MKHLIAISILFYSHLVNSQANYLELNTGIAGPLDVVHLGINLPINQKLDIGFSVGAGNALLSSDPSNSITFKTEGKYKFGQSKKLKMSIKIDGKRKRISLKTWYAGLRMSHLKEKQEWKTKKQYFFLTPTIGRHLNIDRKKGVNIDFGLAFTLYEKIKYSGNSLQDSKFTQVHPTYPVIPNLRIQFFRRIF